MTGYLLLIAGKFHEELYQQAFGVIQSQSPKTEMIQQTSGFMLKNVASLQNVWVYLLHMIDVTYLIIDKPFDLSSH